MQCKTARFFANPTLVTTVILITAGIGSVIAAESKVKRLQSTERQTLSKAIASQKRVNALDDEARNLTAEYKELQRKLDRLNSKKHKLERQLQSQAEEKASLERQLQRVPTDDQLTGLTQQMMISLEAFIQADQPFHHKERLKQVAELKQAHINPSEMLRRLFKAYRDELEYGRTIEAFDGELAIEETKGSSAQQRLVTFLRYGRVALVYQTFDGEETAYWDKDKQRWIPLNGRFSTDIRQGIRIALKRVPPDMMILPVSEVAK